MEQRASSSAWRACGRGGTVVLYSLAAGGTLIIYLRFVCGWRLGDLMYVTRASLGRSLTSVTSGAAHAMLDRPQRCLSPPVRTAARR